MEVFEAIQSRRSIRQYKTQRVSEKDLRTLLESARLAPSGHNKQPWRFIVVRDPSLRNQLASISHNQSWMTGAPLYIVCVADIRARIASNVKLTVTDSSPQLDLKRVIRDTTIAGEHIVLQAQALGLATCWVAWFEQDAIRPLLNIPSDRYVVAVITVGYANESPAARSRKELSEIVYSEKWGEKTDLSSS